jgi:O-succinylhomoserine sulfhydrylase
MKDSTKGIRLQTKRTEYREHSAPLFMTSSFVYHDAEHAEQMFAGQGEGDIYSRFTNPNTTELINKVCAMEGAAAGIAAASGMAAIFNTLAAHLSSGDHVVASNSLFGNSTHILDHILPKWGVKSTLIDIDDQAAWEKAITPETKMVFIETPSNPGLDIIDMTWLGALCKANSALFVVDNCFATPILQKPMLYGADISIHSATKWMDGQGRTMGGIVVGTEIAVAPIFEFLRRTGACMSPFNAWILSKSLETLELRMERHCQNAMKLAEFLENHTGIESVKYPFLPSHHQYELAQKQMTMGGGIVTCNIKGDKETCFQMINRLKLLSITANLGDSRTIITHPATTTHSKLSEGDRIKAGIYPTTLRISVGLEHIDDIISDIAQAL